MNFLEGKTNPERSTTTPATICSSLETTIEHIGEGCFYELDHSKLLPPEATELLKSTRIVMVSEKDLDLSKVSVRFPSLHSLKAFLSENVSLEIQLPAMDERYSFEPETATEVLFRRVPPEELSERSKVWSFWLGAEQGVVTGRCSGSPVTKKMEIEGGGALEEEEEEEEAQPNVVVVKTQRSGRTKKGKHTEKGRMVKDSVATLMPAVRDKMAEVNMVKVKARRATAFRNDSRKLIDIMAGKVAPGGADQCRRRHNNADGALMEYSLESTADLVEIRKESGVQDPSQDPICATMLKKLWKKREMECKQPEQALALVTCMNWDQAYSSGIQQKDKYAQLLAVSRSSKFEEHMRQPSQILYGMEEEIKELKSTMEETGAELMYYSEAADVPQLMETKLEKEVIEAKATKVERLRSALRICRPQGTFGWPNMNISASQHQIDPLAVPTTPSTEIKLDLVFPRSLRGLNEGSSSGSLVNTSTLLCNVTNPPSHSPAFSRVPSEAKDADTRFSPTNLGDALVKRYDDIRNAKGTTAVARIGHGYIHLASDQRLVSPGGLILNDRFRKLFVIDTAWDIVSVGTGVSSICREFIETAFMVTKVVFGGAAHALRVYVAARVLMACIDHWEDIHDASPICNEQFILSGNCDGQPMVFTVKSRVLGGIAFGGGVGFAATIGGGTAEAFHFINTHLQQPNEQAVVNGSIVVASLVNPSTGGHIHSVQLPLHGDRVALESQPPSSVLELLQIDWGFYQPYLWDSLFFVCSEFDYTEQNEGRLSNFLGTKFPGSRTHIISCQTEIIRLITFLCFVDRIAAWEEVVNGYDWHNGGQLVRLTFFEPTLDIVTHLREIEMIEQII